jgi:ABC-type Zn uptake system ZnuABC Zn-binding protein ZnuA
VTFEANLHRFERELDTRMFGAALVESLGGETLWKAVSEKRLEALLAEKDAADKAGGWYAAMRPHQGKTVVTYHRSWSYFVKRFGLSVIGEVEPKPGIPPTAKHLAGLIRQIKDKSAKVVIKEYFEENRTPKKISEETGARIINLSQAVGEPENAKDYLLLMEQNISLLEGALGKQ